MCFLGWSDCSHPEEETHWGFQCDEAPALEEELQRRESEKKLERRGEKIKPKLQHKQNVYIDPNTVTTYCRYLYTTINAK